MNPWRARFQMWLLMVLMQMAHSFATASIPNTPSAMFVYHGSGALIDWLLLCMAPFVLRGKLLAHTQWLMLASIGANAAGWWLYMAYLSPVVYNVAVLMLTCAQWLRLLIPDHYADRPWLAMVRHRASVSGSNHS